MIRIRTKVYFGLTGANLMLALLAALAHSLYLLVIGVACSMFCLHMASVWLEEDLEAYVKGE